MLPDRLGYFITDLHSGSTTDRTPFELRWGGWYVTGTHGELAHAGNTRSRRLAHEVSIKSRHLAETSFDDGSNRTTLDGFFHVGSYLTPHSDIVALMVLTHQARVHNLITEVHEQAAAALQLRELARRSGRDGEPGSASTTVGPGGPLDRLIGALLFVGEAPLRGRVLGTSTFVQDFRARGPRDAAGRSLRDFDLETRLFRYPLSFMIYTEAFDALPEVVRRAVAVRLVEILEGSRPDPDFEHLGPGDRRAIAEILRDTKPELLALAHAERGR